MVIEEFWVSRIQGSTMEASKVKHLSDYVVWRRRGEQQVVSLESSGTKGVKEIEIPTMAKRSRMGRFILLARSR